ncbi:MAG: HEAT repeat domain-containing protein [Pirellulaceae bacterium]|jgi:hypothetical protein|nr:HEAT repeat domain-containing protein [Pirellulaceae bacterium]MDP7014509.1 HEAT repeat domain-containing protein [Pirellulaceae bacterium]
MVRRFAAHGCGFASAISAALLVGLWTPAVRGEVNGDESVSWWVAESVLVVRGTLSRVDTRTKGDVILSTVTVKVNETLKGKQVDEATFAARHFKTTKLTGALQDEKSEFLFFLVGEGRYVDDDRTSKVSGLSLRNKWGRHSFARLNSKPTRHVFTANFQVLKKRDEILAAVSRSVATQAKGNKPAMHRLDVPFSSPAHGVLYGGSSVYMVVAADADLERIAKQWLKSKDVMQRLQAASSLSHFKNEANIATLKKLLADPGYWIATNADKQRTRVFAVRQAAYSALRAWKVDVPKPQTEERLK